MNYSAAQIMNADKQTIDANVGEDKLYREGLEFDTQAKTDVLTEDAPKVQTKTTVDASVFTMADDNSLYG
ncbi:MAG TPA: hypothetical protein DEG69_08975 [Flavobacteriaceae bacterium]|nr:hypothetical protein [Flavobacteriaceae bacterium]